MGMCVTKFKVIKRDGTKDVSRLKNNESRLIRDDQNETAKELFRKFDKYVCIITSDEYDIPQTFLNQGVVYSDDYIMDDYYTDDQLNWKVKYLNRKTGEELVISDEDHCIIKVDYECLIVEEISSFKGMYNSDFFNWSKLDDFELLENGDYGDRDKNAIEFVSDNNMFNESKQYFLENAPINSWSELNNDEIVHFSW